MSTVKFTVEAAGDKSGKVSSLNVAWLEDGYSEMMNERIVVGMRGSAL